MTMLQIIVMLCLVDQTLASYESLTHYKILFIDKVNLL